MLPYPNPAIAVSLWKAVGGRIQEPRLDHEEEGAAEKSRQDRQNRFQVHRQEEKARILAHTYIHTYTHTYIGIVLYFVIFMNS